MPLATVRSSAATKPVGTSLKVTVTVVVSPAFSALSARLIVAVGALCASFRSARSAASAMAVLAFMTVLASSSA